MIRFAEEKDTRAVRTLFDLCFPDESGFNAYYFEHIYCAERTLLYTREDKLCAMVQMLPYRLSINGAVGEATYIYGACTHPAHRRKHLMAQLLEASFKEDRRKGRIASFLIPQEAWLFDFYRPFGYLPTFSLQKESILRTNDSKAADIRELTDWQEADRLYRAYAGQEGCYILRGKDDWRAQITMFDSLGAGAFGLYEAERLTAYAFVWKEADSLLAQEMLAETLSARELLAQALLHRFDFQKLVYGTVGKSQTLGCLKPYLTASESGYINLMFN